MNIYARIRKIEDPIEFKRLVNTVLGAEYGKNFQSLKEWHDSGVDGYIKNEQIVCAVYCPMYPERKELSQYRNKIREDIGKLAEAISQKKIGLRIKEWMFITPDDLPVEVIDLIREEAASYKWSSGTLTAQVLAPLFMKHSQIHPDFPAITAGLQFDRIPSVDVRFGLNRSYKMLELFNDGTEDIKNIEFSISENGTLWRLMTHNFLFEFDDPLRASSHSLYNLKKGERQYCNRVPGFGEFHYKLSGIGVESGKTFIKEGFIEKVENGFGE